MTPTPVFRKPKLHFDTASRPSHVTFDDGKALKSNIPWSHYVEARWEYGEPDIVKIEIGGWFVVIRGHNLGPLFIAIEDQMLLRVRAQPSQHGAIDGDKQYSNDKGEGSFPIVAQRASAQTLCTRRLLSKQISKCKP